MLDIKKLNISSEKSKRSIASYNGWLKWCNSYNLKQKYMIKEGDLNESKVNSNARCNLDKRV